MIALPSVEQSNQVGLCVACHIFSYKAISAVRFFQRRMRGVNEEKETGWDEWDMIIAHATLDDGRENASSN